MVQALQKYFPTIYLCESKEQASQSVIFQGVCLVFPALSDLFPSCLPTQTCTTTSAIFILKLSTIKEENSKDWFWQYCLK